MLHKSKITCCFNCNERTCGCHSTCEKYKREKKINDDSREELRRYCNKFILTKAKSDSIGKDIDHCKGRK